MMVDVRLRDGRTTMRFLSRGQVIRLLRVNPEVLDEARAIGCWVKWNPDDEWQPMRMLQLGRTSISFVKAVAPADRDAFLASIPPDLLPASMRGEQPVEPEPAAVGA